MKDSLGRLVRATPAGTDPRNVVREYLQGRILESLQRAGAMVPLAFLGGTALRFLYGTPRYSEDLDFSLEGNREAYDLAAWMNRVKSDFAAAYYDVDIALRASGTVHAARIAFPGLLAEMGLSPHADENLWVKLEADTNPPAGARTDVTLVRRGEITLRLNHHDRASLLGGKINAVLTREWVKGRDIYDLVWYLADPAWPSPNLALLNNALAQFDSPYAPVSDTTWRSALRDRLASVDWAAVTNDVRPFLEKPGDIELASEDAVRRVLTEP